MHIDKKKRLIKKLKSGEPLLPTLNGIKVSYNEYRVARKEDPTFAMAVDVSRRLHDISRYDVFKSRKKHVV